MNRIILNLLTAVLLLAALGTNVLAAPDIQALIDSAPGSDEYPLADQIMLYENIEITLDAEGRSTRRVYQVRKILTNWAMRRITDPRVGWDSSRQELDIAVCRTYQAGGAVVDSPANAFNEVTPDAVGRSANFLGLREMVISHVGLEPGSIVELDYTIRDLDPAWLPPSGQEFFQDRWPVLERTITLQKEVGSPLWWEVMNGEAAIDDRLRDEGRISFTVRDIAGLPDEGNGARRGEYSPCLVYAFGMRGGWNDLAKTLFAEGERARVLEDDLAQWVDQSDAEDRDLTQLDTVQRVAAWIGNQTRTVHLPAGNWSLRPRTAPEVFRSGSASPWEEAILAATLLDDAGLAAEIYLVSRFETVAKNIPAAAVFDRILVSTRVDDQEWWLSPEHNEAWSGPSGFPNRTLLRVLGGNPNAIEYRRPTPAESGSSILSVDLRPDEDGGILATIDYRAEGLLCGGEMDSEALAKALAATALAGSEVSETEVLKLDHNAVHVRLKAKADSLGDPGDGVLVLDLPRAPHGALSTLPRTCRVQEPKRHTDLFLPGAMTEEMRLRLTLPDGFAVDYLPPNTKIQVGGATYVVQQREAEGGIDISFRLELPAGRVEPSVWPDFRELLSATRTANAGRLILVEN